jgi:hypothetical protein
MCTLCFVSVSVNNPAATAKMIFSKIKNYNVNVQIQYRKPLTVDVCHEMCEINQCS